MGCLPHPPVQPITTKIGMGCPEADVINHDKFQLIGSGVSEPQMAENRYLLLTCDITLTTVLHCDTSSLKLPVFTHHLLLLLSSADIFC